MRGPAIIGSASHALRKQGQPENAVAKIGENPKISSQTAGIPAMPSRCAALIRGVEICRRFRLLGGEQKPVCDFAIDCKLLLRRAWPHRARFSRRPARSPRLESPAPQAMPSPSRLRLGVFRRGLRPSPSVRGSSAKGLPPFLELPEEPGVAAPGAKAGALFPSTIGHFAFAISICGRIGGTVPM